MPKQNLVGKKLNFADQILYKALSPENVNYFKFMQKLMGGPGTGFYDIPTLQKSTAKKQKTQSSQSLVPFQPNKKRAREQIAQDMQLALRFLQKTKKKQPLGKRTRSAGARYIQKKRVKMSNRAFGGQKIRVFRR